MLLATGRINDLDEIMDECLDDLYETSINHIPIPIDEMLIMDLPDIDSIIESPPSKEINPRFALEWTSLISLRRCRKI